MTSDAVLTLREAATELRMHYETVRELVRTGQLRAFKAGSAGRTSAWRVRRSEVQRFIADREAQAVGAYEG